ncbi:MAG: serine hydrolase, partial [Flavobacteriales bacterium]
SFSIYGQTYQKVELSKIRKYMDIMINSRHSPGIVVGIIDSTGHTYYETRGYHSYDKEKKITENTIFEIGSLTKIFTATLLTIYDEKGKVNMNDRIGKYLPDSITPPQYKGKGITLKELAMHFSGLPRLPGNLVMTDPKDPYADYTEKELYEFINDHQLENKPGEKYQYSNVGYGILGHILATNRNSSFKEIITQNLLNELNMENTYVKIPQKDKNRFAQGHQGVKKTSHWHIPTLKGAGILRSTPSDLSKFMKAEMGIEKTAFNKAIQKTQIPYKKMIDTIDTQYMGLGWHIMINENKDTLIWHSGGTGGFSSYVGYNKQSKQGVVILSNSSSNISKLGQYIINPNRGLKMPSKSIDVNKKLLKQYKGTYKSPIGMDFFVRNEGDQLYIAVKGQQENPVYPISKTKFEYRVIDAEIKFNVVNDTVKGLTLFQYDRKFNANKVKSKVPEKEKKEAIDINPKILDRYTGKYKVTESFQLKVWKKDDQLVVKSNQQAAFPVYPETKNRFFYKAMNAKIEFHKNEQGQFNSLTLYRGGRSFEGKKVK